MNLSRVCCALSSGFDFAAVQVRFRRHHSRFHRCCVCWRTFSATLLQIIRNNYSILHCDPTKLFSPCLMNSFWCSGVKMRMISPFTRSPSLIASMSTKLPLLIHTFLRNLLGIDTKKLSELSASSTSCKLFP